MTSRWMYTYIHIAQPVRLQRSTYLNMHYKPWVLVKVRSLKSAAVQWCCKQNFHSRVASPVRSRLQSKLITSSLQSKLITCSLQSKLIAEQAHWKLIAESSSLKCSGSWSAKLSEFHPRAFCNLVRGCLILKYIGCPSSGEMYHCNPYTAVSINATLAGAQLVGLPPQFEESSSWSNHT